MYQILGIRKRQNVPSICDKDANMDYIKGLSNV